jgi:uncharacterized membrane protein YfcA
MSPPELVALVALTFAACALHAAVGFGSGPLLMPLLLALTSPARAVVTAVGVGMVVNALQLAAEGRRPQPSPRRLWPVMALAPPGAVLGAALADRVGHRVVSAALAIALLLSAVALLARPPRLGRGVLGAGGAVAGFSAALTGVFGPVLGVLVTGAGLRGDALRDGIGAAFLAVGTCAIAATIATHGSGAAAGLLWAAALSPIAAAGHVAGRRGFARLTDRPHRAAVLAAVAAGCLAALLPLLV